MARQARKVSMDPSKVQVFHVIKRCVRRSFLCGTDSQSGKCYDHRKQWLRERMEFLCSIFAVDLLTYTVLSNHCHLILRSRPDLVCSWTDWEVANRWWRLCPQRKDDSNVAAEPTDEEINMLTSDAAKMKELRQRLSDISWWVKMLSQKIAKRANQEDGCTGHFWEGRFKSQALLDEAAILACAAYVDLNPIRAAIAQTPETSDFTGVKDRIDDTQAISNKNKTPAKLHQYERTETGQRSGWMSPLQIDELRDPIGPDPSDWRRASKKGFLNVSLYDYLELIDWTGRQLVAGKSGVIPDSLAPILQRLGIVKRTWCDLVRDFGQLFRRAVGGPSTLADEAQLRKQAYLQAPGRACFTSDG